MPSPLEAEISTLLASSRNPESVANELVRRWQLNLFNAEELADCAQFMIAAGIFPPLFRLLRRTIEAGTPALPWAQVAEALGRAGIKPKPAEMAALIEGAEKQNAIGEFLKSRQLELFDRSLSERRAQWLKRRDEELNERKQSLRDKLQFMRANRLLDEEAKVIQEMQAVFPEASEVAEEARVFQLRAAHEALANATTKIDIARDLKWKIEQLTPEQVKAKGLIFERAKELAKGKPERAYDLALSLHMMELHSEALGVLEGVRSYAADWLRLELLLQARKFLTALDEIARLEVEYAADPESSFSAVYARARALYGLGQKEMAIDLLRSLLKVRPSYASAQSLLLDWTGGEA